MTERKLLVATVALFSAACAPAFAADLLPAPQRVIPAPIEVAGGWYLRGDIGVGIEKIDTLDLLPGTLPGFPTGREQILQRSVDGTTIIGAGIGYQFNEWLRFDLTGEYRTDHRFRFLENNPTLTNGGATPLGSFVPWEGSLRSFVGLANVYFDLGNFYGVTPFLGAGVGFANHDVQGLNQLVGTASSFALGQSANRTDLAWALHAGLAYTVNENLKLELSYRYLNMGDLPAVNLTCTTIQTPGGACYSLRGRDLTSSDIRIGMRWTLNPPPAAIPVQQPVIARN